MDREREREIAANLFDKIRSVVAGEDQEEAERAVCLAGAVGSGPGGAIEGGGFGMGRQFGHQPIQQFLHQLTYFAT